MRVVRQKIQPFALHGAATPARGAPHFQLQNNPKSCTRKVANMSRPSVIPPLLNPTATAANRFFERRSSRTTRTCGSPNTPRTLAAARKPANEYPSDRRRCRFFDLGIPQHGKIERTSNLKKAPIHKLICRYDPLNHPLEFLKTQQIEGAPAQSR